MLSAGWVVAEVMLAILLTFWVTFTLTRLDRLHARVDAAQASLDAQLVRRAAALLHLAELPLTGIPPALAQSLVATACRALHSGERERETVENAVGRAIGDLTLLQLELPDEAGGELAEAVTRVGLARRFFNDAVQDTRTLRGRRMSRWLHLAGHRAAPSFFDIDDTATLVVVPAAGETPRPTVFLPIGGPARAEPLLPIVTASPVALVQPRMPGDPALS